MARNSLKNVCRLIDSVVQELPPEKEFLNDLKRSIEIDDSKNRGIPSKTYKPSSMNCIRNMYFQIVGAEPDKETSSYNLIGICNSGTDTHFRLQLAISGMRNNGMGCDYIPVDEFVKNRGIKDIEIVGISGMETKLYHKKLNMSFLCDGIIKYKDQYYILEIKTESSFKWQNRSGVDPSHYNQGTAYSVAFGLNRVVFLYVNRDTLDMKTFMFNVTDEMKNDLVGRIFECDSYVEKAEIPPKPEDVPRKACEYCNYKSLCKG